MPKFILCLLICSGCTFNVSVAHTEGTSSDTIDGTQTPTANISPTVQIPLTGK